MKRRRRENPKREERKRQIKELADSRAIYERQALTFIRTGIKAYQHRDVHQARQTIHELTRLIERGVQIIANPLLSPVQKNYMQERQGKMVAEREKMEEIVRRLEESERRANEQN